MPLTIWLRLLMKYYCRLLSYKNIKYYFSAYIYYHFPDNIYNEMISSEHLLRLNYTILRFMDITVCEIIGFAVIILEGNPNELNFIYFINVALIVRG